MIFLVGLAVVAVVLAFGSAVAGVPLELGGATRQALWQGPAGLVLTALLGVAFGALQPGIALAVFLGYVAVATVLAAILMRVRDV